jgi:hypothetical protein
MTSDPDGYTPQRPHANIPLSDEARSVMNELAALEDRGELFEGDTASLSRKGEAQGVVKRAFLLFAADLRRFIGAGDRSAEYDDAVAGLLARINLYSVMISWTDADGWTYWGVHDYLRDESRYLGKTKGGRFER